MTVMDVQHVEVPGLRMAYLEAGQGEPIVFVHGNFASKRWFTEQLKNPPPGWRVIAPDLPNFGKSDRMPGAISIEAYADYLAGFIGALKLTWPVLVGHSLGGAVVQQLAVTHPDRVRGLVLISAPSPEPFITAEEHYALLASLVGNRELLAQALMPTIAVNHPKYFPELVEDALAMKPEAFTENGRALAGYSVSGHTQAVEVPVLVMRGARDYLISEALARATAEAYENSQLELFDDLGHSPQLEDPERFHHLLEDFLRRLP